VSVVKILIGTDGSELSVEAAQRALAMLATPTDVVLLTVLTEVPGEDAGGFEGSVYTPEEREQMWEQEKSEASQELDRTADAIRTPGVEVERRVAIGSPAEAICDVAKDVGADVIVVGSHGRGFVQRVLLGSVSEHVVRHAPCPVLVVRHQGAATD